jgi:tRNA (mo5U34)-methyltransferase
VRTLQSTAGELAPRFHNLHLPDGRQTAPDHPLGDFPAFKWRQIAPHVRRSLAGTRALDIGCNAGFYSFELAKRGASVLAVDVDEHYLSQGRWAAEQLDPHGRVEFREMTVYDLAGLDEQFDVVLFLGVLYHLRHPLLALDIVAERVRGRLLLQTLTIPGGPPASTPEDVAIDDRDELLAPRVAAGGVHRAPSRGRPDELVGARRRMRPRDGALGRDARDRLARSRGLHLRARPIARPRGLLPESRARLGPRR